ncbi:DUF1624 domain-containing protein [Chitinophaga pendula]|uniref:DUF1624 domain-containing protein n=1 Tax=Chitinophaga TaxID=79328 RepID=UPI000BAFC117|nr:MULTISPECIES: heparan-alpha-glucosaminide N-acetyltransferase domain-containing protein [Chitinophaga]ASZ11818.1 hypothetical protein CK934_13040 [Chitinophaga sp. MD30]UCJ05161.1 DUF1624 domain-containing protein [Chitinophaga pendula]
MQQLAVPPKARIHTIDILRGIIMVIMALDHVRDFFHIDAFQHDPVDPATTTPILFFTRWITHFCAPIFVLLSGTAAFLAGQRRSPGEQQRLLLSRGLWLLVVEITIINFSLTINPAFHLIILQVLWAIGFSMILLSLMVKLQWQVILLIGILITGSHNLLDAGEAISKGQVGPFWIFLHRQAVVPLNSHLTIFYLYPILPWTGIMFIGYALGRLYIAEVTPVQRKRLLLLTGMAMILLFVIIRWANKYGDPQPWSIQATSWRTFLSFLNISKYPPSLSYTCVTIGTGLLILAALEGKAGKWLEIARTYGAVPFFYYVAHFYLIRILSVIYFFIAGYGVKDIPGPMFFFRPPTGGLSLFGVYLIWITVVVTLYLPCRWFAAYKRTHRQWWLSYV